MKTIKNLIFFLALFLGSSFAVAGPVNINTASAEDLAVNIVGVGAKKAQAIIEYREKYGPFKRAQDLTKVKGIGAKILEKNMESILVMNQQKPVATP